MTREDIAVIGIACRFPGAQNKDEFWHNLCNGRESLTTLSDDELLAAGVTETALHRPTYVRSAFLLDDVDKFDARFFGITDEEARVMDPQQRVLLEVAYEALEDAGHVNIAQQCLTGVFATCGGNTTSYLYHYASRLQHLPQGTGSMVHIGNDKDFLATRLSFKLNLTGPSMTVQTACSSSMMAVHLARTALLMREIDLAIVGASCVRVPQRVGYDSAENPLLSPTGHCNAFSDDADGTVFGSGVAAVILRRGSDSSSDNDNIYALIKSTASTNDGSGKIGYTAASVPGQAKAMMQAIATTDVSPKDISYVECHGTATKVGDPLEIKALEKVFRLDTTQTQVCGIGSVKTNIGHLEQAAGLASLIKLALMLKHKMLVPSLNYRNGNRKINFEQSPFRVVDQTTFWPPRIADGREQGRVAGLNSLGIGGTNLFALLAEAPIRSEWGDVSGLASHDEHIFCLSAKTQEQLIEYLKRLAAFAEGGACPPVKEFCYTVNVSRSQHQIRYCSIVKSDDDLGKFLRDAAELVASEARLPAPSTRRSVYVCNSTGLLATDSIRAFRADVRFSVLRSTYDELCDDGNQPPQARHSAGYEDDLYRTLAFEVALYHQLNAWGIHFDSVEGIEFGQHVSRLLTGESVSRQQILSVCKEIRAGCTPPTDDRPIERAGAMYTMYRNERHHLPASPHPAGCHVAITNGQEPLAPETLLRFLVKHLSLGRNLNWDGYYNGGIAKVSLPTYPFRRDRHWCDE